jgi:hypothetical protein
MKLNELIQSFEIYTTNEEKKVLENLSGPELLSQFNERDQLIIDNLVKKSLVSKLKQNNNVIVVKNEY